MTTVAPPGPPGTPPIPEHHHPLDDLMRSSVLPHIWCPGCGIGTALGSLLIGMDKAGIAPNRRVMVSGIGCSSRSVFYADMDTYHTTHGRSIPFATGLKLGNPDLAVTVFSGDGDLFAIGGNHFIHAARRNMDLLVVCINNFNYGMTGGQGGPTTPRGARTTTTPLGNVENPFNLPFLAAACGATYVARFTTLDVRRLRETFEEAVTRKGFRFIEVLSPCPVSFGKSNKIGKGVDELEYYRGLEEVWTSRTEKPDLDKSDIRLGETIHVGRFIDRETTPFHELYAELQERAKGGSR